MTELREKFERLVALTSGILGTIMVLVSASGYDIPDGIVSVMAAAGMAWGGLAYALGEHRR